MSQIDLEQELTPEEFGRLPARLRVPYRDAETREWADAKAARDEAIAAAYAVDADGEPLLSEEERAVALEAARADWTAFKKGRG